MGIKNLTLKAAATVAATGGTDLVFADDGITIPNGVHIVVPADTSAVTRRHATFRMSPASLNQVTQSLGRDSRSVTLTKPIVTASGKVINQTFRIERQLHPEETAANAVEFNNLAAQLLVDSDTALFWSTGSTS